MTRRLVWVVLVLAAACGRRASAPPTAPLADPCVKVDTLWSDKRDSFVVFTVYYATCPVKKS